jgi:hypothetical protein
MARLTTVGIVGVLAATSISVAASWAQPAEPAQCKGQVSQRCGNNSNCVAEGVAQCDVQCMLENETKPVPRPNPR